MTLHYLAFTFRYDDMDFESKPIILVVGPYSVGKSTFIKYLIGMCLLLPAAYKPRAE